jgi:hypothetical protein
MSFDRRDDDGDRDVDALSALAKQLDPPAPTESRVEAMRATLLRAAADDRREIRPRWPLVVGGFTGGALAAAAAVMVVMHGAHPATTMAVPSGLVTTADHRAQIEASTAADFERQVTHSAKGNDEVVRLHAGRISLAVADLPKGDRVRVAANNGEIEGAGVYEVSVVNDAIAEVIVKEGTAKVRITGHQDVFLAMGQAWKAPLITAEVLPTPAAPVIATATPPVTPPLPLPAVVATPTPVPTPIATQPRVGVPLPPPTTPTAPAVPALQAIADAAPSEPPPMAISQIGKSDKHATALEQHFAAGWQLLRAGKNAEAARELAAAATAGGDAPLAGDARYFQAIALTKAGRKTEAEHALVEFLDRSPHALRRGRAAVMLGRLIAERGDPAAARTWFEAALGDSDANVNAAAKSGLANLH